MLAVGLCAAPAWADEAPSIATESSVFSGDFLIVGAGAVAGRIGGIGINARSFGLALDLIPDADRKGGIGFTLGPVLRYRTNRSGRIVDDVVAKLGKLKGVVEAGVVIGIDAKHVLNPYDSLSFSVDLRWDVSGCGSGLIVAPGLSCLGIPVTPQSGIARLEQGGTWPAGPRKAWSSQPDRRDAG
ncbi:MAG: hypothetical protein QM676_00985 [Novosphingobium sp.]